MKEVFHSCASLEAKKKEGPFEIDSAILNNQGQADFLKNILGNPKRIERIFRASEHNFRAAAFHEKCDNKRDTLTLVRTEFGKTIGGYSHYPWDSSGGWLSDEGMRAFLFSLDRKEKYVPNSGYYLIFRHNSCGPTFGGGHDLCLRDSCNIYSSSANFPYSYNRAENKIANSQESYANFSGATNGYNFRVVEYEVFQVQYQ